MSATLSEDVQALKELVLHNPVSEEQGNIQGLCVLMDVNLMVVM